MEIKYSKHKQELREDPILDSLIQGKEFVEKNSTALVTLGGAVLLGLAVFLIYTSVTNSNIEKAQDSFGRAMLALSDNNVGKAIQDFRSVIDTHGNTPQSVMSEYMLGSIMMNEGKYGEAITWYESAVKGKSTSSLAGSQALEGLANCYEAKGDKATAIQYLEKALQQKDLKFRYPDLRWKLALLSQKTDITKTRQLCNDIISDTLATEYHQRAENLLATLEAGSAG